MKLKDFLSIKLKKDGKINNAKLDAAIESAPDWDFDDEAIEAIENSFFTLERAVTDKSVNTRIRREALDAIDRDLHEFVDVDLKDHISPEKRESFKKNANTYEKIKALSAFFTEATKRSKGGSTDEELKKKLKTFEETNQELLERNEKLNSELQEKEKHWEKHAEEKINTFRLEGELQRRMNSIKLAKGSEAARNLIAKGIMDELKAENALSLIEKDGQAVIQVMDKEGKPRFNGNSAVTIDQLLEEKFKPFIPVNNVGNDDDDVDRGQDYQPQVRKYQVNDQGAKPRQGSRTTVVQQ